MFSVSWSLTAQVAAFTAGSKQDRVLSPISFTNVPLYSFNRGLRIERFFSKVSQDS